MVVAAEVIVHGSSRLVDGLNTVVGVVLGTSSSAATKQWRVAMMRRLISYICLKEYIFAVVDAVNTGMVSRGRRVRCGNV